MTKLIIGIVSRFNDEKKEKDFVYEEYRMAIIRSGGIPILLLPIYTQKMSDVLPFQDNITLEEKRRIEQMVDRCDGVLFPGGEKWYGFDQYVYQYAYQQDKPILGICLGMQMIACFPYFSYDFSDQTQPIVSNINHKQETTYVHTIFLANSKLRSILNQDQIMVNSRHSSFVLPHNSFCISATSEDGIIEAIEIPDKTFIIGVQWHPESVYQIDENSKKLFLAFMKASQQKRSCYCEQLTFDHL